MNTQQWQLYEIMEYIINHSGFDVDAVDGLSYAEMIIHTQNESLKHVFQTAQVLMDSLSEDAITNNQEVK